MPTAQKKKADEKPQETTTKKPIVDEAPPAKTAALTMPRFGLAEESRNIWYATVEHGTLPAQVLDEAFWSHVARLLQPGDEIIVMADNFAWRKDVQVLACGSIWAQVAELQHYDLTPAKPHEAIPSKYKVEFAGAHHKWRVLREGEPLKDGFASEKLARQWAAQHEAAVNR
jgi:hypothetical protein